MGLFTGLTYIPSEKSVVWVRLFQKRQVLLHPYHGLRRLEPSLDG